MPRNPRIHYPLAVYHVTSRGVEKRDIFLTNADRAVFLAGLTRVARETGVKILAYCLMGNHFHFLLSVSSIPLGRMMQRLLTYYSHYFNHVHRRTGHLFGTRYNAVLCEDLGYLLTAITYIHMNPVKAGLAKEPGDWEWSSHGELTEMRPRLLDQQRLEEVSGMRIEEIRERYLERIPQALESLAEPASPKALLERAALRAGVAPSEMSSGRRGGPYSRAKREFILAMEAAGYTDLETARLLGCSPAAICYQRKKTF